MSDSPPRAARTRDEKRLLASTLVGTTIEWYDFFIYAQAASLVFAPHFFAPLSQDAPGVASLLSLATIGISFLFRPLGAVIAGRFGDRLGRKAMLVMTLIMMGSATALIGLLPTYAQIGVAAPLLLIVLRIVQGFSAGGEWGGAALMAVEHAPLGRRGYFGSYPQTGVPLGLILATGVLWAISSSTTEEQFNAWGWRIPFLLSVVLIVFGYLVRRLVEESPVFQELLERRAYSSAPLTELFRTNSRNVVLAALIFIANNAAGYLVIAYFLSYGKTLGLSRPTVLAATIVGAVGWLVFTVYSGGLSDRIGRVRTFQIGYAAVFAWMMPMFFMMETGSGVLFAVAIIVLSFGIGLSYGPMSALYAEMFSARVRYSGVSIGYAFGAILGGAFAPTIATALTQATGSAFSVGAYVMVLSTISFLAVTAVREPRDTDLNA
ncbi:MFS transporter [Saccharopolyspora rhizosphaerae]|uniref:Putative proline/betaine transporter n=1 Tax=Saccharopolyspora rhizosphaerae TaxID=2492662 RepID=A0A426JMN2_9PSEU|nr:MFS transporter [Saccharopolyspora rhizosphaerae]RRO14448.1 MFS transporter [Saccharopolyspora rhizosphaerae]